jgi:hypothetical protein
MNSIVLESIEAEANASQESYGDFASMHEGYGVLAEEVAELLEAIRLKAGDPKRSGQIRREAIQVAAVAARMAEQAKRVTR